MKMQQTLSPKTRHGRVARSSSIRVEPLEPRLLMAVWSVINNNDSGAGSLRAAITSAANNDTINFNTTGQITLLAPLMISKSLTIGNTSGTPIRLNGNLSTNLITISTASNVKLQYMTLAGGSVSSDGGAVIAMGRDQHRRHRQHYRHRFDVPGQHRDGHER